MLFGLFYSPASIIIIIFYANPSPLMSIPPYIPIPGSSWRRLVQPFIWLDPTLKTICLQPSQSVIASSLPPVIRNIDPPLYPGNFPPFSAPGVRGE